MSTQSKMNALSIWLDHLKELVKYGLHAISNLINNTFLDEYILLPMTASYVEGHRITLPVEMSIIIHHHTSFK